MVSSRARLRPQFNLIGAIQASAAKGAREPGMPQVSIFSDVVDNGRPIGIADAGQHWHTDMSYKRVVAFVNVHRWSVGDVLLWERFGTWHCAAPAHRCDARRLMKRCQVLADRVVTADFVCAACADPG